VMVASAAAHYYGALSVWWLLGINAFAASLLHELEHDLIHSMYFSKLPVMQDVLLTGIWLGKVSMNPWARRKIHLLHHATSGMVDGVYRAPACTAPPFAPYSHVILSLADVEERLIGLGLQSLLLRFVVAVFPMASGMYIKQLEHDSPSWKLLPKPWWGLARMRSRIDGLLYLGPLLLPLLWRIGGQQWAYYLWVSLFLPNTWRHACIVFMSTYCHYYGDIPAHVTYQNQILHHWAFLPFQVFCCDFGATHIIHHYVVNQTFIVRHLVRHRAWKAMEATGVRVNDLGLLWRANRWGSDPTAMKPALADAVAVPGGKAAAGDSKGE